MNFFTLPLFVKLFTSATGSCAFALIFKTHRRHLLMVSVSGLITYFVYYTVSFFGGGFFVSSFAATCFAAIFGELCARIFHAPTILYLVTGLIPIVPGGEAYYAMKYLLESDMSRATEKLLSTGGVALGIAGGIALVSLLFGALTDHLTKRQKRVENKHGKYQKDI